MARAVFAQRIAARVGTPEARSRFKSAKGSLKRDRFGGGYVLLQCFGLGDVSGACSLQQQPQQLGYTPGVLQIARLTLGAASTVGIARGHRAYAIQSGVAPQASSEMMSRRGFRLRGPKRPRG